MRRRLARQFQRTVTQMILSDTCEQRCNLWNRLIDIIIVIDLLPTLTGPNRNCTHGTKPLALQENERVLGDPTTTERPNL